MPQFDNFDDIINVESNANFKFKKIARINN